jgi:hypothetical protein
MKRLSLLILTVIVAAAAVQPGLCGETATGGQSAFDRIKGLAGTWEGTAGEGKDAFPVTVQYRVTANGTAVMETLFPGTPHEMVTIYTRDGDGVVLTHYCAEGNQPLMKLDASTSKPDELRFAFAGGNNIDPATTTHMHELTLHLLNGDHLQSDWTLFKEGKKERTEAFHFARKAS